MYTGPIIDAHHHLWDIGMNRHRWLVDANAAIGALGDISYMRKTYLPADFLVDVGGRNLVGSVHIEAHWDRSRDPVEETEWLESIDKPRGVASRPGGGESAGAAGGISARCGAAGDDPLASRSRPSVGRGGAR